MKKTFKYMVELYRDFDHDEQDAERYHFDTLEKAETFIGTSNAKRDCSKYCVYELVACHEKKEPPTIEENEMYITLKGILKKNS